MKQWARYLRVAVIRNQFEVGNLTEHQSLALLRGRLKPSAPDTRMDDSALLYLPIAEVERALGFEPQQAGR
jgi:hypothetical protein